METRKNLRRKYENIFEYGYSWSINKTIVACGKLYRTLKSEVRKGIYDSTSVDDSVAILSCIVYQLRRKDITQEQRDMLEGIKQGLLSSLRESGITELQEVSREFREDSFN